MSNLDSFGTSSGLPDEYNLEIRDAVFVYDAKYNDGQTALLRLVGLKDGETEITESWPCGKDWVVADGGARIEHKSGDPKKKINENSAYGRFLNAFVKIDGALDMMAEVGGDAFRASSWEGFTLHLVRQTKEFKIDGQDQKSDRMVPDAIVSYKDSGKLPLDKPEEKQAPVVEIPEDVRAELTKLAAASGTFEEFIDGAYVKIPDLSGAGFEDHVADDGGTGFYATSKG